LVALVDVRRLAAVDMWGTAGTRQRRRLIRAEFFAGAIGCTGLGLVVVVTGSGWMAVLGIWLVGAGVNYVPLAIEAQLLSKPGALEQELHGVDLRRELRSSGVRQLWIAVPFGVAVSALVRRRPRR